jgi:hypothetical protein
MIIIVIMDKLMMYSRHFHALLSCNDILRSMTVRCFIISMSITIHIYSERSISVDGERVWENDDGIERDISPAIHKL